MALASLEALQDAPPIGQTQPNVVEAITLNRRIPELDGLRGIAILLVLVWHYVMHLYRPPSGSIVSYFMVPFVLSWSGVDLFLVLSGFLIGGILIDAKGSPNYFKTFFVRRICRIFPLYYLSLFLFILALNISTAFFQGRFWLFERPLSLLSYTFFLQNIFMAHSGSFGAGWLEGTWSLAVEEQFYMSFSFIINYFQRNRLLYMIILFIVAAPVLRIVIYNFDYYPQGEWVAVYSLMPCRADALCLGVLSALLLRKEKVWNFLVAHRRFLYPIFVILLLGVAALILTNSNIGSFAMTSIGYTWLALFYLSLLLIAVVDPKGIFGRILRNRVLREFGYLSYNIYLFHEVFNSLFHAVIFKSDARIYNWQTLLTTVSAFITTVVFAKLSWHYFEKPIIDKGRSFTY